MRRPTAVLSWCSSRARRASAILAVTEALQPDVTAAPKAQAVIADRLARLSEPAAALAGAAAAIGRAFSPDVLQ